MVVLKCGARMSHSAGEWAMRAAQHNRTAGHMALTRTVLYSYTMLFLYISVLPCPVHLPLPVRHMGRVCGDPLQFTNESTYRPKILEDREIIKAGVFRMPKFPTGEMSLRPRVPRSLNFPVSANRICTFKRREDSTGLEVSVVEKSQSTGGSRVS
ncbi:hypothetical protein J6590_001431 [Homalodisca vitripennis]|nr:hypothetical protein J6590_001431 [Homalodisca vitripennis]